MAKDEKAKTEGLKEELEAHLHPTKSKADPHEQRALETLVALLDSEDESIRLRAAQTILDRHKPAATTSKAAGAVKTISKAL